MINIGAGLHFPFCFLSNECASMKDVPALRMKFSGVKPAPIVRVNFCSLKLQLSQFFLHEASKTAQGLYHIGQFDSLVVFFYFYFALVTE